MQVASIEFYNASMLIKGAWVPWDMMERSDGKMLDCTSTGFGTAVVPAVSGTF